MKTFAQFKQEQKIDKIQLLQGDKRKYCSVSDIDLVVGKDTDLKKDLFVIPMSRPVDDTQPIGEGNSEPVPGVYLLINSKVKVTDTI